jgi:MFS family permease
MQMIAIDWHIYSLLEGATYTFMVAGREISLNAQALGLGGLGLVRVLPIILFALLGGMIADMRDRRTIMLWTQSLSALLAVLLAVITLTDRATLIFLYLLTSAGAAATAFDSPARQALVPNLVARKHLTNAVSLNTLIWQIGTIVGPAVGGLLVSRFNIGIVYALNALSFVAVILALIAMRYRRGEEGALVGFGLASMVEGFRFVRGSRMIWSTMLLDFFATLFSQMRTMLPIIAGDILRVGPQGYGLLVTAQPVGALIAGAVAAMRRDIHRQGAVLLISVAIFGLATAWFGLSTIFALSYVLFAVTGAADTISAVIRGTIRQLMTPDHLRGRMTSVNMVFFMGGPQLGELRAGVVASAFGAPFAIFSGGIITILITAWVAWRYPRLRNYTSETEAAILAEQQRQEEARAR